MKKYFNTSGPCRPDEHYMLPAQERCRGLLNLIERKQYFVIHAARQSGKTTLLLDLMQQLNRNWVRISLDSERVRDVLVRYSSLDNYTRRYQYRAILGRFSIGFISEWDLDPPLPTSTVNSDFLFYFCTYLVFTLICCCRGRNHFIWPSSINIKHSIEYKEQNVGNA